MKAIETEYKGYRFRSRLEARWAVFLDSIDARWDYEPEGYELPSGWYLPDFFVHYRDDHRNQYPGAGAFLEIKPLTPSDREKNLLVELSHQTMHNGILAVGMPGEHWLYQTHRLNAECTQAKFPIFFDEPRDIVFNLSSVFGRCSRNSSDGFWIEDERASIYAARGARFERRT